MRKTKLIRVYIEDAEILKKMNGRSMAQAINQLIYGREEELKEACKYWFNEKVMPYITEKLQDFFEKHK